MANMAAMSKRQAYALVLILVVAATLAGIWVFSGILDRDPPVVYAIYQLPPEPEAGERVVVHVFGDDRSGVGQAEIFFRVNASSWEHALMERIVLLCCPPRWVHDFGAFSAGTVVDYYFVLTDQSPQHLVTTTGTLTFEVLGITRQEGVPEQP